MPALCCQPLLVRIVYAAATTEGNETMIQIAGQRQVLVVAHHVLSENAAVKY